MTYPSIKRQKLSGVGVVLDLLRCPETKAEGKAAFHLAEVNQGTDGVAHVLHQINPTNVLLASEYINLDLLNTM